MKEPYVEGPATHDDPNPASVRLPLDVGRG